MDKNALLGENEVPTTIVQYRSKHVTVENCLLVKSDVF